MSSIMPIECVADRDSPPGTVRLSKQEAEGKRPALLLRPTPTRDPNDPLNWSNVRKTLNFGLACFYVLITFVYLGIGPVAYGPYIDEFGWDLTIFTYANAANYAGLSVGCILFIPLIHRYGRRPVYLGSLAVQLAAGIWSASLHSAAEVIAVNAVSGIGGAIAQTIVQVTVTDLFFVHQRARMNGVFLFMQFTGAFLGPVAAGYIVDGIGWRWMWWVTSILAAVSLLATLFLFEETLFVPALEGEPSTNSQPATTSQKGDSKTLAVTPTRSSTPVSEEPISRKPYSQRLALITKTHTPITHHFHQPVIIFFTIPAVTYVSLMLSLSLALFAILSTTLSYFMILPPYNFGPSAIGLLNVAPFIGSGIGSLLGGYLNDYLAIWCAQRNKGIFEPEMRLYLVIPSSIIAIAGLAMFGMGLAHSEPWPLLACGFGLHGFGISITADGILTYITDAYVDIISHALVAVTFFRNALAIVVLFALTPWLDGMGLRGVFIISTCLALLLLFMTVPMIWYGKRCRYNTQTRYRSVGLRQGLVRGA